MTAGLMKLAAYGAQDVYLTGRSQVVYKKYYSLKDLRKQIRSGEYNEGMIMNNILRFFKNEICCKRLEEIVINNSDFYTREYNFLILWNFQENVKSCNKFFDMRLKFL